MSGPFLVLFLDDEDCTLDERVALTPDDLGRIIDTGDRCVRRKGERWDSLHVYDLSPEHVTEHGKVRAAGRFPIARPHDDWRLIATIR